MTSAVLIVPAADRDMANAFGESMGWGPNNYSVPLTTDGTTISHYGCRADVGQGFLDLMLNPPPEAESVLSVLVSDFRETDGYTHFHEVIAGLGLSLYVEEDNNAVQ
jgi:hypothetical protein